MANRVLRVLVVDDSAYMRKTIRQILSRSPYLNVVGIASDGEEALEKVKELQPDVVTLDLLMPGLGGLGFLTKQMALDPLPVILLSTVSDQHALVLKALEAGAVDFVHKPSILATATIFEVTDELIEKVKAAGAIQFKRNIPDGQASTLSSTSEAFDAVRGASTVDAVVIGISTGGPQGLKYLIPQFAEDFPAPIAIVLHIPVGYTAMYASRLDDISPLKVMEAKEGDRMRAGVVLLAPGGLHLTFRRNADNDVVAHLDEQPFGTQHRPSIDVMFESAAEIFRERTLGIVMTGMGSDGTAGAASIKAKGGRVFTESRETSVVYGMPAAVVEAGFSDRAIPQYGMAEAIWEVV